MKDDENSPGGALGQARQLGQQDIGTGNIHREPECPEGDRNKVVDITDYVGISMGMPPGITDRTPT